MRPELSIIIPIKIGSESGFRIERLSAILAEGSALEEFEFVVVDSSIPRYAQTVQSLCSTFAARYVQDSNRTPYSSGEARNAGARAAKAEHILFLDADLLVNEEFYIRILRLVRDMQRRDHGNQFFSIPCIYLNAPNRAPDRLLYQDSLDWACTASPKVSHLATATSTLLLWKKNFDALGGFNSSFVGYGCEDLDLLHRLATLYPLGRRNPDYDLDVRSKDALQQKGFRRYFAHYCLPLFYEGIFTVHLWHPRPLTNIYYRRRRANDRTFNRTRKSFDLSNEAAVNLQEAMPELPPLDLVLNSLPDPLISFARVSVLEYPLPPMKPSWSRRIRKLILHPRLFFRDFLAKKKAGPGPFDKRRN